MYKKSSIDAWLAEATKQLTTAGISSARLDAEIIMTHTLRKGRTYIHAHGDEMIEPRYLDILDTRLALRLDRVPIAYIIGHKGFYGRNFKVTPATLIPRPESEAMIDMLKEAINQLTLPLPNTTLRLVDVGTGSGCLGITAKLEAPELDVTLVDISQHALTIAEENARRLQAKVTILKSSLLQSYPFKADFILANLPYVSENWEVSPETKHEPHLALFAGQEGLALIATLIEETPSYLTPNGILYIEADPRQHDAIAKKAAQHNLQVTSTQGFIVALQFSCN